MKQVFMSRRNKGNERNRYAGISSHTESYLISSSNHNADMLWVEKVSVVSYLISSSNHNE